MAVYQDREAFIPYRRADLIELCLEDNQLTAAEAEKFRDFCSLLSAYYHFKFHSYLERLKDNYAPFNPDDANKSTIKLTSDKLVEIEAKLVDDFQTILNRANYVPITLASLKRALEEKSVIELKTKVDFADFDQIVCYYRGYTHEGIQIKKLFRQVKKTIDVFERVVLLLKFKDEAYFIKQNPKADLLNFTPGKMYVYFYKKIPKYDLELLFPNLQISMTWKDRLLLIVPAVGAAIPAIIKVIPKLLVVVGAILFFTVGPSVLKNIKVSEAQVRNIMPVLVATLTLGITLGGFAYKQYSKYKSKHIEFRKKVTDTLFFKNLANNTSVFHALVDAAEEEECKEIILVYYHLLISKAALTSEQLDNQIENWMDQKFGTKINFDINGPIDNLEAIRGKIIKYKEDKENQLEVSLLRRDAQGNCHVLPLNEAKQLIDYIWDNIFLYT